MKKIKALLASAQPMLIWGFLSFFSDDPIITPDAKKFLSLTELPKIEITNFDVIILDDDLLNYLKQEDHNKTILDNNEVRKIIYAKNKGIGYITKMIKYGTDGIVSKDSESEEIRKAIIKVKNNGKFFCENTRAIINKFGEHYELLTPREKEIFYFLEEGLSNIEISEMINISYRTVENHKVSICQKFGLPGRRDLMKYILNG